MPQSSPIVQNVVSFVKLTVKESLDLKMIAEKVQGSRYNRKRFPAVILRKTKPKSTILIFESGKMIIIGSESEKDASSVATKSVRDIGKYLNLKDLKIEQFRVTNIVANADLGWKIDLNKLMEEDSIVRVEDFPGLVYRKHLHNVKAALLFSSGKVVFTGAQRKEYIDNAFIELKEKLRKFMVKPAVEE